MTKDLSGKWEKRWHPLRKEWVVYAGHRNSRPWSFDIQNHLPDKPPVFEENCYLCPGNKRISGLHNPNYSDIYIFDNDHPVVGMDAPEVDSTARPDRLYKKGKACGIARVVCYHPRHDLTMADIPAEGVGKVFEALKEQMMEFTATPEIKFVLIFENKGELVGVSNPHPHCQIYATDFTFTLVERAMQAAAEHRQEFNRNLFEDIIKSEEEDEIRIIAQNKGAIAFVPYFARYAYEVMIFPRNRHATLSTMSTEELHDLASVFQEVTRRFDMNYNMIFPYVMSVLQAPVDGRSYDEYHMHLLIQPPLRQPGLIKYLAGPEIGGGNFMADTMPEKKAAELRAVDTTQYDSSAFFKPQNSSK